MEDNFNKNDLIEIIRKILIPLTPEEITEVCESLDGIMEYIYNNLINAVIDTAGEIIYD